jgi:hypothetical protein
MWILHHDKKRQFLFAPLSGQTARRHLHAHFDKSTMVLVEAPEGRRWLRGEGRFSHSMAPLAENGGGWGGFM